MKSEQVQALISVGSVFQFTASDSRTGPKTWAGVRLQDGLAVCTDALPGAVDSDQDVQAWFQAKPRRWFLVQDASPGWCFADWYAGHGEPVPMADEEASKDLLAQDEDLLLLAASACELARQVYLEAWAKYQPSLAVDLEVVAVYPAVGEA